MKEGWQDQEYLILFDEPAEASRLAQSYGLATSFPGFSLVGLLGWDDFILRHTSGAVYSVPTVPAVREKLRPLALVINPAGLWHDPRFAGRIKWYLKPIVFGGDPRASDNITWL